MSENDDREWALLAEFGARYQADLLVELLESNEIPVLQKGPEEGIFGPGFSGPTALGVLVYVPESRLEEAEEIRDDLEVPDEDE